MSVGSSSDLAVRRRLGLSDSLELQKNIDPGTKVTPVFTADDLGEISGDVRVVAAGTYLIKAPITLSTPLQLSGAVRIADHSLGLNANNISLGAPATCGTGDKFKVMMRNTSDTSSITISALQIHIIRG